MFDFGANIRDEGGVKGRNNKGLITYDRKIKKDAFYMYKANWSDEKFVHITSKRFVDRADKEINVKVYSNCDAVTLYVNGTEVSTKTSDDRIFLFENIELAEGITEIKVTADQDGQSFKDVARFTKVNEPNESYKAPEEEGGPVANWFEMPDLEDVEVEELTITDDVFSTRCTFGQLFENEEARAVLNKYLTGFEDHPMFGMAQGFVVEDMAQLAPNMFNEKMLYTLNKELTQIKKS
jgi:beta-galactosidase